VYSGRTSGVGKVGRPRQEERQRKLVTEGKVGEKKVTFRLEEEVLGKKESEKWKEECREIIGEEVRGLKKERKILREEIKELKDKVKECIEKLEKMV